MSSRVRIAMRCRASCVVLPTACILSEAYWFRYADFWWFVCRSLTDHNVLLDEQNNVPVTFLARFTQTLVQCLCMRGCPLKQLFVSCIISPREIEMNMSLSVLSFLGWEGGGQIGVWRHFSEAHRRFFMEASIGCDWQQLSWKYFRIRFLFVIYEIVKQSQK